jgi:phosphoketolase
MTPTNDTGSVTFWMGTLKAGDLLQQHLPELKVRVVNVVTS